MEEAAQLSLMTIHCAKGLEFPVVFLVGMEEDVFPNRNARDTDDGLEEERRLFYVAITRAQRKLYLTAARATAGLRERGHGHAQPLSSANCPRRSWRPPSDGGPSFYQSGQGATSSSRMAPRGGGGASVASELQRIRGFFDRVKAVAPAEAEPAAPEPILPVMEGRSASLLRRPGQGYPGPQPPLWSGGDHFRDRERRDAHLHHPLCRGW